MIFLYILGGIVVLIAAFIVYRLIAFRYEGARFNRQLSEKLRPMIELIEKGTATEKDVRPLAENLATSSTVYEMLQMRGKLELFPKDLLTIEKGAAASMARWLSFPTELDTCPDEMEHAAKVKVPSASGSEYYHVFKFRINKPHWGAKYGWMLGVAGPYDENSKPFDHASGTFSRLTKADTTSPEDEAKALLGIVSK